MPSTYPTSRSISTLFTKHDLTTVALNRAGFLKSSGVKVWWLEFSNLTSMEQFIKEVNGSTLNGKKLVVNARILSTEQAKNMESGECLRLLCLQNEALGSDQKY